jgi:hypothetical protein
MRGSSYDDYNAPPKCVNCEPGYGSDRESGVLVEHLTMYMFTDAKSTALFHN